MKRVLFIYTILILALSAGTSLLASAQTRIQLLFQDTDKPVIGATIHVDGIEMGTSNSEGVVNIRSLQSDSEICFSGLDIQRKCIGAVWLMSLDEKVVYLEPAAHHIKEVLVHSGYEKFTLRHATGSFTVIDQQKFDQQIRPNILTRLEGLAPGILYDKRGGVDHSFSIRGLSTMNSDQKPLIIVDEFPYEGDISLIHPEDVASITVLRDAAAAAIWGAKAGNGVLVITTKRGGRNQKPQIDLSVHTGITQAPDLYYQPQISSADFIQLEQFLYEQGAFNALLSNTRTWPVLSPGIELLHQHSQGMITGEELRQQQTTFSQQSLREDLNQYVYRQGLSQQYRMSVRSGGAISSQLLAIGYDRSRKNQVGNEGSRLTVRANNDLQITDYLRLSSSVSYAYANDQNNALSSLSLGTGRAIYPYARLADSHGNPLVLEQDYRAGYVDTAGRGMLLDWRYRPLDELNHNDNQTNRSDLVLSSVLSARIFPELNISGSYQYTRSNSTNDNYQSVGSYTVRNMINRFTQVAPGGVPKYNVPMGGILDAQLGNTIGHALRTKADWNKNWDKHHLDMLAAFELSTTSGFRQRQRLYGYDPDLELFSQPDYVNRYPVYGNLSSASYIPHQSSRLSTTNRFVSVLTSGRYVYDDRFILSASARRDASNLFGVSTNNKWKPLWSAGLAWNLHEESFWDTAIFPVFKLRMSHGYSGNVNNSIPAVLTMQYQGISPLGREPYALVRNPPNANLRWEEVRTTNMAVDFAGLKNRLRGSLDVYYKKSTDLISTLPADPTLGFNRVTRNASDLENWGWDLTINSRNIQGAWQWNTDLMFSKSRPMVTRHYQLSNQPASLVGGGTSLQPMVGYPFYSLFSYRFDGLTSDTGDPIVYLSGKESAEYARIVREAEEVDIVYHGSVQPTFFGSLHNHFGYGGFGIDIQMTYRFDYYFRRPTVSYSNLQTGHTLHADYDDRWQQPGDELRTTVPSFTYPFSSQRDQVYANSSATVEKGDHIRVQHIALSYVYGKPVLGFRNVQASALIDNVNWYLWKASGTHWDPDLGSSQFPFSRTISLSLKLNF